MTKLMSGFPSPHGISLVQAVAKRQLRMHLRKIREREYFKLRSLVPAVASKKKVSKVQVIEEAVRYIEELHTALVDRFREQHGCLAEDKAKETVQIFVNRMMEEQPQHQQQQQQQQQQQHQRNHHNHHHHHQQQFNPDLSATTSTTTGLTTIDPSNNDNIHDSSRAPTTSTNNPNHRRLSAAAVPSPIYHQNPHNHHRLHHHHHHQNENDENVNNARPHQLQHQHQHQVVLHAVQHPVPPRLFPTTPIFQENVPATCSLRRPSASSRLLLVRRGRKAV